MGTSGGADDIYRAVLAICFRRISALEQELQALQEGTKKAKEIMEGDRSILEAAPAGAEGWWQVVTANPDDPENPIVTTAYRGSTDEVEMFIPATPARITPSKRKPVVRDHDILFVFGDAQIDYRRLADGSLEPIHDERAIRVAHMLCREIQPEYIINLGDTVDLAALSRFKRDSDHFQRTLGPSFQRVHDMYAQFRADTPHARIIEVDSNHNTRLKDHFMQNVPDFYGFKRAGDSEEEYPMFTYPYLANLGHAGVEWISGYSAAAYVHGAEYDAPPIVFRHGTEGSMKGRAAAKVKQENPETHVVQGHSHTEQHAKRTTRAGRYLSYWLVPALCKITGEVPSYHSAVDDRGTPVHYQEDWSQGVLIIRDYRNGDYEFQSIPIREGLAYLNGKLYSGEEPM